MSSKDFGLGPKWWQKPGNKLQKCSERKSNWCDPTETDGCCAIIACTYCLELEPYGGAIQYGTADFVTEGWEGTVGGNSFFGFWEKDYEGICEFVVLFNGVEVYRESCEGGQSCRDSSDETVVVIDYEDYTLRWIRHEPLPLQYVKEDETNCTVHFCDDCECSCECLCVVIKDSYGVVISRGEICNISYPCGGPIWEGVVGYYDLSIALGRNEYGQCIITATVDGVEQAAVLAPGCGDMAATIELEDGTIIEVRCKKCSCDAGAWPCCDGIGTPDVLYLTLTTISMICSCLNGQVITLYPTDNTTINWEAIWQWPCTDLFFPENVTWFRFRVFCDVGNGFSQLYINSIQQLDTDPEPDPSDPRWITDRGETFIYNASEGQCDPFYFKYTDTVGAGGNDAWIRCQDDFMDDPEIEIELTL